MSARIDVALTDDADAAVIKVAVDEAQTVTLRLSDAELEKLIVSLGQARRKLVEKDDPAPIEGMTFAPVYRTNWALQIDALTEGSLFAFQHPAYGAIGVVFTPTDSEQIVKGLQKHRAMVHSTPEASARPS